MDRIKEQLGVIVDTASDWLPTVFALALIAVGGFLLYRLIKNVLFYGQVGATKGLFALKGWAMGRRKRKDALRKKHQMIRDEILEKLLELQAANKITANDVNLYCQRCMHTHPIDVRDPVVVKKAIKKRLGIDDATPEEVHQRLAIMKGGYRNVTKLFRKRAAA